MLYLPLDTAGTGHNGYQQQVKETNIKRIFDLVRSGKCKSRAELVRTMKLSATSISVLVEELTARNLIDEVGPARTSLPGRRPISLRLNSDAHQIVVFTLDRKCVHYTLLDLSCRILETFRCPLETDATSTEEIVLGYLRLFEDILARRSRLFDPQRVLVVNVCFSGIYDERNHLFYPIQNLGITVPESILRDFQSRIGLPVYVFNNTHSMAYAEKKYMDATHPDSPETLDMVYMAIDDGISCSIISNGSLYTGPYNISGLIGHFTINYDGRPCRCGNTGCLERYVSLSAILEDAREAARSAGVEPPETIEALARRYADEPALKESVYRSARLLAFGLYNALCSSGMRKVVLGGEISLFGEAFLREVYRAVCQRKLLIHRLDLSYAQAGPDARSVGVAHYYLDKIFTITS